MVLAVTYFTLMLAAATTPSPERPANPGLAVECQNERISVRADKIPLRDVLLEIQNQCRIIFNLKDKKAAAGVISTNIQNQTVMRALENILEGLNFAYFYTGKRLARVIVLPPGAKTARAGAAPAASGNLRRPLPGVTGQPPKTQGTRKTTPPTKEERRVSAQLDAIDDLEEKSDAMSLSTLANMLTDTNADVKLAALQALSEKDGNHVTQLIRRGLNDSDPEFRIEVLDVLAERGDLDSVRRAKSDPNEDVREWAADLLDNHTP